MELKRKLIFIILIFMKFYTYTENYEWCNSILKKTYFDNQFSYWIKTINEIRQNSNSNKISETEYLYSNKEISIYEDISNLSGENSKDRIPCIVYKILPSNSIDTSIIVFIKKNETITLQVWHKQDRVLFINYDKEKYKYTYFGYGKEFYSFEN